MFGVGLHNIQRRKLFNNCFWSVGIFCAFFGVGSQVGKFVWCGFLEQSKKNSEERSPEIPFGQKNADADQIYHVFFLCGFRLSP